MDDTKAEKAETFHRTMERSFSTNWRAMEADDSRDWYIADEARVDLMHKTTNPDRRPPQG